MIIKSKTSQTPRFGQLLDYLTKHKDKYENERGEACIIKQHLFGLTNERMAGEFLANEQNRIHHRANNTKLVHEIISFSNLDKDKITIPILKDLTTEYLRQRSPFMQAFAIGHFDTQHLHVHIVSSPIELVSCKNLRQSKADFAELKQHMQAYQMQKFPELTNSIVNHGRKEQELKQGKEIEKSLDSEFRLIERLGKNTNKAKIKTAIENSFTLSQSKEQFYEQLSKQGFQTYKRGGDYKGVSFGSKNYRFNTIINDYNERLNQLDQKRDRLEDISSARDNSGERESDIEREDYENNRECESTDEQEHVIEDVRTDEEDT